MHGGFGTSGAVPRWVPTSRPQCNKGVDATPTRWTSRSVRSTRAVVRRIRVGDDPRARHTSVMTRPLLIRFLAMAVALGACADDSAQPPIDASDPNAQETHAVDLFWDTYHGNRYADIASVQVALQAALDCNPSNGQLTALLGATHFWHVAESARDPNADPQQLMADLPTAIQLFQQAASEEPDDDHLIGFIGVTTVHVGALTHNAGLIARGDQALATAVYRFPEFNNFNRWAAHNAESKNSPGYQVALEALWEAVDACAGAKLDRANPDITPYLPLRTTHGRKSVCWEDNRYAPFAPEGIWLNL